MESSKYLCHCFEMGAGDFEGGSVLMGPMISLVYGPQMVIIRP